jgi:hypothetical protein
MTGGAAAWDSGVTEIALVAICDGLPKTIHAGDL